MVENLPSNAGDTGSTPGWRTKIPHAVGQLGPRATIREVHVLQLRPDTSKQMTTYLKKYWDLLNRELGFL